MSRAPDLDGMITITGLYTKRSKRGDPVYAGRWGKTPVFVVEAEGDGEPRFWLVVKREDYAPMEAPGR